MTPSLPICHRRDSNQDPKNSVTQAVLPFLEEKVAGGYLKSGCRGASTLIISCSIWHNFLKIGIDISA